MRLRSLAAIAGSFLLVVVFAAAAGAQATNQSVTLEASATKILFGRDVRLSGSTSPATGGETIEIRDSSDAVVDT
ncbi:MAG: hypothetical protein ACRDG2_07210, partial [Actinomycetota bacterium]